MRDLLTQGVDVNTAQPDGATALHWAAYWNDEETVDVLLRAGAAVNAKNELGATPLWLASTEGRGRLVERLLEAGADPNAPLLLGETPLMSASRAGSVAAAGADPRFVRDDGTTILMAPLATIAERFRPIGARDPREEARATEGATLDVLKAALELGADVNAADREGNTALHAAASRRLNSVVRFLADNGANLDVRNKKDETPLALASQERRGQQAAAGGDPAASEEPTTADLLRTLGAKEETNETKPR